ncbi:hypothetical protein [Streptomyces sp. NPDC048527]|uniref:hypothetical protein n=1 Tax=Streptomyces sp. NPDC048527 TaxID=3365568 RepID=UPI0037214317
MGIFVFLLLVPPPTTWPVAHLATQRLHPRTATGFLTGMATVLTACSTPCLALLSALTLLLLLHAATPV